MFFEYLELRDESGSRFRLLRDKIKRSSNLKKLPEPGRILHQDSNGNEINEGFVRLDHQGKFQFDKETSESVISDDTRPLLQFLSKIRSGGRYELDKKLIVRENDCDARFIRSTQELICSIYDLGDRNREYGRFHQK